MEDYEKTALDAIENTLAATQQRNSGKTATAGIAGGAYPVSTYPDNGGPPDLTRIGELSARGIDRISIETADQIREIGEAAVTRAEALRSEANTLADNILEQGRKFSDRVASFTATAEAMLSSMNEQRARLHKTNSKD